jgi:hypothetical protein
MILVMFNVIYNAIGFCIVMYSAVHPYRRAYADMGKRSTVILQRGALK